MGYLGVLVLAAGLAAVVWYPWRRRRPLTWLRVSLLVGVAAGTVFAMWLVHELDKLPKYDHFEVNVPDH